MAVAATTSYYDKVETDGRFANVLGTGANLADIADAAVARTNLGLGTAATQNSTAFADTTLSNLTDAGIARANIGAQAQHEADARYVNIDESWQPAVDDVITLGDSTKRFNTIYARQFKGQMAGTFDNTMSTDDLLEGSSNLYYTDARARAAISESSTQLAYNSSTGVLTFTQGNTDTVAEGSSNLYYTDARADARIVAAGSANWNTAYTDTNAATDANTNSTLVKRDGSGNFAAGQVTANTGVILGSNSGTTAGTVRWSGTDFQGYDGSNWVSLTSAATAQISGAVATFTTSPTVTGTSFADISGYTSSITVTNSNIINVQVNVDLDGPESNNHSFVQLVRVVGGTPTVLYEDESGSSAAGEGDHFNITYADTHGQSSGTVITLSLIHI